MSARGQSLALFALTLLLLSLMVTSVAGFAQRAALKGEAQDLADAAAYSEAVATARALNDVAVLNRVQIAHLVSLLGTQALISFGSRARAVDEALARGPSSFGALAGRARASARAAPDQATRCGLSRLADALEALGASWPRAQRPELDGLDAAAAQQARDRYDVAMLLYARITDFLLDADLPYSLAGHLGQARLANEVARAAGPSVRALATGIGARELRRAAYFGRPDVRCTPRGCQEFDYRMNHLMVTLGTRPAFTADRSAFQPALTVPLARAARERLDVLGYSDVEVALASGDGGGGSTFARWLHGNPETFRAAAISDDTGRFELAASVGRPRCRGRASLRSATVTSVVRSNSRVLGDSLHTGESPLAAARHHLIVGSDYGGAFPQVVDYDPGRAGSSDAWGQPRTVSVMARELGRTPLDLRVSFGQTRFDGTGLTLRGVDQSLQAAVGGAAVYYHRAGHWREPPNLLNPYWRATLAPLGRDGLTADELDQALGELGRDEPRLLLTAELLRELTRAGYRGL